jgi:PhoH-like ATPase
MSDSKTMYVLDTNVLMHDPSSLFRFHEHDIFLTWKVVEELDKHKKGNSEIARNVRQAHRFLNDLTKDKSLEELSQGVPLSPPLANGHPDSKQCGGKLFIEVDQLSEGSIQQIADNTILESVKRFQAKHPDRKFVVVSKDFNMCLKTRMLGIEAEDYQNDQVIEDADLLYVGHEELPKDFWNQHSKETESWQEDEGRTFYRVSGDDISSWYPGLCLKMADQESFEAIVRSTDEDGSAIIELLKDHRKQSNEVWGINARNLQQNYALNLLLDPEIDFVTLLGIAGTGKTLLALAAGLHQVMDLKLYNEIIMTRVTVPVGEDIGFLPGTEEEKMTPWMGALMDNLEFLTKTSEGSLSWEHSATEDLLRNRIRIHSLNFMRGRTFLDKFIIIDEAQNLTAKQMKTLVTRAGPGSKIVCLGNIAQIDTPYLTETSSGLTYAVERFKDWTHSGHITLQQGERSRLADHANNVL